MNTTRLAVLVTAGLLGSLAPFAQAAPSKGPQLVDSCGNQPAGKARPGYDVKSFQLTTTGTTRVATVRGRRVVTYTPKNLVAVLSLCGKVQTTPGSTYTVDVKTTACGTSGMFTFRYTPGNPVPVGDLYVNGCGPNNGVGQSEYLPDVVAQPAGDRITWTMPLSLMGRDLPLSTVFRDFSARVDLDDPVSGEFGTNLIGNSTGGMAGDLDYAHSDASWKLG